MAHRISYMLANGAWPNVTLHSCDLRSCCNPQHLRSGTHKENTQDCIAKGRFPQGSRSGMSKLSEEAVRELRSRNIYWGCRTAWAAEFGVDQTTISEVLLNQTWKHVEIP